MSLTSHETETRGKNIYSFDEFVTRRESLDWYRDEPFLQKVVKIYTGAQFEQVHEKILAFRRGYLQNGIH
jgi:hypothetical protein